MKVLGMFKTAFLWILAIGYLYLGIELSSPYGYNYTYEERVFLKPGATTITEGILSWPVTVWKRWNACGTITGACHTDYEEYCARFKGGCEGLPGAPRKPS